MKGTNINIVFRAYLREQWIDLHQTKTTTKRLSYCRGNTRQRHITLHGE